MAYVLLIEHLERQVLADRQVAATFIAQGGDMELPSFGEARDQLDAALIEDPTGGPVDEEQAELRRALGV